MRYRAADSGVSLKVKSLLKATVVGVALPVSWAEGDIVVHVLVNAFMHTLVFASPLVSFHEVP